MDSVALIEKYFDNLSEHQREQFARLGEVYQEWNSKINVVSRKDMEHIYLHHILHSLAIAKVCRFADGAKVLDVGCGGGFPSVPLAIMFPEVEFTACDSIGKKIRVVEGVCEAVGIKNIRTVNVCDLSWINTVTFRFRHLIPVFVNYETVSNNTLIRSFAICS